VVSYTPQPLYPSGKEPPPRYPLDGRLGGLHSQSGRGGEEKKLPASARNLTLVVQRVIGWDI